MNVTITCDRCGKTVEGIREEIEFQGKIIPCTGGFYDVKGSELAQSGEVNICDECMWADPAWQKSRQ